MNSTNTTTNDYLTWPVGTTLSEIWKITKVEGNVMTITRREFVGSYNEVWNGGGYYVNYLRKVRVRSDYTSEEVEPLRIFIG